MLSNAISITKTIFYTFTYLLYKPFGNTSVKISIAPPEIKQTHYASTLGKASVKNAPKKINALTYIRALAVLAVITLHSSGELLYHFEAANPYKTDFVTGVFFYSFLRWATPFFILISGTLMLNTQKNEESIADFLKKRVTRVLIPFLFWAVIYFSYENRSYFFEGTLPHYQVFLKRFFFEDIYYHLWFIQMIIGLYILTPFIKVFLKSAKKNDIEYFLALCFITSAIQNFYPTFFIVKYFGWFSYIGFYLLGHYLSTYPPSKRVRKGLYIAGILSILAHGILTLFVSDWTHAYYDRFFMYISPTVGILTAALFTYLRHVNWQNWTNQNPKLNTIALKINELSFGIYFIHVLILDLLKNGYIYSIKINYNSFFNMPVPPYIGVLGTAFSVAVLSFITIYFLQKISFLRRFLM